MSTPIPSSSQAGLASFICPFPLMDFSYETVPDENSDML